MIIYNTDTRVSPEYTQTLTSVSRVAGTSDRMYVHSVEPVFLVPMLSVLSAEVREGASFVLCVTR